MKRGVQGSDPELTGPIWAGNFIHRHLCIHSFAHLETFARLPHTASLLPLTPILSFRPRYNTLSTNKPWQTTAPLSLTPTSKSLSGTIRSKMSLASRNKLAPHSGKPSRRTVSLITLSSVDLKTLTRRDGSLPEAHTVGQSRSSGEA